MTRISSDQRRPDETRTVEPSEPSPRSPARPDADTPTGTLPKRLRDGAGLEGLRDLS